VFRPPIRGGGAVYAGAMCARPIRNPHDAELAARDWLRSVGFVDAEAGSGGPDGGVDVRASGLVAQVKAEMKPIGLPVIQRTYGIARAEGSDAACFALSGFTQDAIEWADQQEVALFVFDYESDVTPVNVAGSRLAARAETWAGLVNRFSDPEVTELRGWERRADGSEGTIVWQILAWSRTSVLLNVCGERFTWDDFSTWSWFDMPDSEWPLELEDDPDSAERPFGGLSMFQQSKENWGLEEWELEGPVGPRTKRFGKYFPSVESAVEALDVLYSPCGVRPSTFNIRSNVDDDRRHAEAMAIAEARRQQNQKAGCLTSMLLVVLTAVVVFLAASSQT
jgi:hypothetical protein